jgi:hypothetical protein
VDHAIDYEPARSGKVLRLYKSYPMEKIHGGKKAEVTASGSYRKCFTKQRR